MAEASARLLGALELSIGGVRIELPGPKQRAVLATLALHANQVVAVDALVDSVWGEQAPERAEHSLQQHISAIRKALEPALGDVRPSTVLMTRPPGYLLALDSLDVEEFERAASSGFELATAGRWPDAVQAFDAALATWRGPALSEFDDSARLSAAAVRLNEQRLGVLESRFEAQLENGQARDLIPELEHLVGDHPLRERLRAQLMLALYRAGRQADALAAFQAARRVLIDEIGIEPGAELRKLEQAILAQSTELDTRPSAPVAELYATFRANLSSSLGCIVLPDGQIVLLPDGSLTIGRDPASIVRFNDSRVSRHHAVIETAGDRSELRDLASTNGTAVNGVPGDRWALVDGDLISIGGVELRFERKVPPGVTHPPE